MKPTRRARIHDGGDDLRHHFESRYTVPAVTVGRGGKAVSDTYMLVHQTLAGDGTVTTRVTSLSGAHTLLNTTQGAGFGPPSKGGLGSQLHLRLAPWAKAGIILEPDTNQGTQARPGEVFAAAEAGALLPLPEAAYDVPVLTRVKVHRDLRVEVARSLYSAPQAGPASCPG
jgi:hypothetical protein